MILNRRQALKGTLTCAVIAGLPVSRAFSAAGTGPAIGIVDLNLAGAEAAAATLRPVVGVLHTFSSDPGPVWMHIIEPALKAGPTRIAGYCSQPSLFCLHYLARDYGLGLFAVADGDQTCGVASVECIDTEESFDPRPGEARKAVTWLLAPKRS